MMTQNMFMFLLISQERGFTNIKYDEDHQGDCSQTGTLKPLQEFDTSEDERIRYYRQKLDS